MSTKNKEVKTNQNEEEEVFLVFKFLISISWLVKLTVGGLEQPLRLKGDLDL